MTIVESFAAFVCGVQRPDIPERVFDLARRQVMSVVASLHAGWDTPASSAVRRAVLKRVTSGPCTVIPTGEKVPLEAAIALNGAAAMALDYDDYLYMGHTSHSSVLGAWALCEELGRSTDEWLLAQVIGNEIAGRMGASAVLGPQNGQAWAFIHAAGGAAVGARLLGLDEERCAHALAIALYQPPRTLWPGFMGGGSKVLTAATPTLAGIHAARLAAEGLTGALDIVENPAKGFWRAFTFAPLPHMVTGLGRAWLTDTLAFKRYPGCAYIDTTIDALLAALASARREGAPVRPEDVASIRVDASLLTIEMDNLARSFGDDDAPPDPVNINFSIPWSLALAADAGRLTSVELGPDHLADRADDLRAWASKVELRHDWEMTLDVVDAFEGVLGDATAVRALGAGDLWRTYRGFRRELGAGRTHSLRYPLLLRHAPRLAARIAGGLGRRLRGGGSLDLGGVDFTKFRMAFPARVTIETKDGRRITERRNVPIGAPGVDGRAEAAEDKLLTEASRALGPQGALAARDAILALGTIPLDRLAGAVCART